MEGVRSMLSCASTQGIQKGNLHFENISGIDCYWGFSLKIKKVIKIINLYCVNMVIGCIIINRIKSKPVLLSTKFGCNYSPN